MSTTLPQLSNPLRSGYVALICFDSHGSGFIKGIHLSMDHNFFGGFYEGIISFLAGFTRGS